MSWDLVSFIAGYTTIGVVALLLQDRSHQREIWSPKATVPNKIIQMYDQQTNYQTLMIEQLRRALDALKKAGT